MFSLRTIILAPARAGSINGVSAVLANKHIDQSRSICHKSNLQAKKVYRWPYEYLPWNYFTMWFDPFTKRKFNENTKLIVVDGNIAAGKENVAKRLADELGMLYMPPNLDMDALYINEFGFDYRAMNSLLPERLRICDLEMWHDNPTRHSMIHLQHNIFRLRIYQYLKALRHMFNTGQGVVLTRSCLSDRVFVEAMHNLGWLPQGYVRADGVRFYDWKMRYKFLRNFVLSPLPKPHLVVYVDTPVDVCLKRIQDDPDPNVRNSKALTREFLDEIEAAYKDIVLPKYENNGHVYTVSGEGEFIDDDYLKMIEDFEGLDFEHDPNDTRFEDWDDSVYTNYYRRQRYYFTSPQCIKSLDPLANLPFYDIAGLGDCITHADLVLRQSLYEQHIGEFGWLRRYENNSKIHGFLKAHLSYEPLEVRLKRHLRLDFS